MPNPPTANMNLVTPVEDSAADAGDWDRLLNDIFDLVDAHDHSSGKGARVPTAGLNINAALPFGGNRATGLAGVDFNDLGAVLAAGAQEIFSFAGNMYWRNGAGQNVQVTSGATINAAAIGGIVGDYSSIGAEAAYVDADDRYTFKQQLAAAVRQWARLGTAGVDLYEYQAAGVGAVPANRVRLSSPAALAASYEVTWPGATPATSADMRMSAAGVISTVTSWEDTIPAVAGDAANAGPTLNTAGSWQTSGGAGEQIEIPVPALVGRRVTSLTVGFSRNSGTTITLRLVSLNLSTAVRTTLCSKDISAGAGALSTDIGSSPTAGSLPQTFATGLVYLFEMISSGANDLLRGISVVTDRGP